MYKSHCPIITSMRSQDRQAAWKHGNGVKYFQGCYTNFSISPNVDARFFSSFALCSLNVQLKTAVTRRI